MQKTFKGKKQRVQFQGIIAGNPGSGTFSLQNIVVTSSSVLVVAYEIEK